MDLKQCKSKMNQNNETEPPLLSSVEKTKNSFVRKNINHINNVINFTLNQVSGEFGAQRAVQPDQVENTSSRLDLYWKRIQANSGRYLPHIALLFVSAVVLASNFNDRILAKSINSDLIYVDPNAEQQIVQAVDPYTNLIGNDSLVLAESVTASQSDGFAKAIGPTSTQITAREEPLPDNSGSTVNYIVRAGDTLTGLGWKFEVKIASIKYVNDIDNIDTIKPGTKIKIPPKGYEVSAAQIAQKAAAKQAKLALSQRSTITRNASSARAADANSYNAGGITLSMPINYKDITQRFSRYHTGIDLTANVGTTVVAAADGIVIRTSSGWSGGYGNMILVDHGGGVITRYAHLSQIGVSPGDSVSRGEAIARSGNSGHSTGPHLHFEKIINGNPVSPF